MKQGAARRIAALVLPWLAFVAVLAWAWRIGNPFADLPGPYSDLLEVLWGVDFYYDALFVRRASPLFTPSAFLPAEEILTVQQDLVWSWPLALPTDYWTRPASLNNRGWWPILGNWPGTGYVGFDYANWDTLYPDTTKQEQPTADFTPWVQAPNTAHILWKRQGAVAGLIGGPAGQYGTLSSPGFPSLIYSGRCYQTVTKANGTSVAQCYDLRTGEIYYEIPGGITPTLIAYVNPVANLETIAGQEIAGQTWSADLLSISGSYLRKINPWTGALSANISISPLSGGTFHNQVGGFVVNIQDLGAAAGANRYRLINWTTLGTSTNFTTRIHSNTTYARSSLPTLLDFESGYGATVAGITQAGVFMGQNLTGYRLWTGEKLWSKNVREPVYSGVCDIVDHGIRI